MTRASRPAFATLLALCAVLWFTGCATAPRPLPLETIAAVDAVMETQLREQQIVGAAVGVIVDGRVRMLKGYGWADREAKIPVDEHTLFRWASISKPLTAVAALQLWERGRLDLDADVRALVPEWPDKGTPITTRQLLGHQGGIVHYSNGPVVRTRRSYDSPHPFADVVQALDTFKESPLVAAPGEKYSYTTHGFMLLSAVVERAGREPFAKQVDDRIAKPLRLHTLQPDYQWIDIPGRTIGYRRVLGVVVRSTDTDVSWKLGGGGYISNIGALTEFGAALLRGELVRPATRDMMWTPQRTRDGKATRYGMGFSVTQENGRTLVGHSGSQEKTKTYLLMDPAANIGVAVMCNSEHADPGKIVRALLPLAAQVEDDRRVDSRRRFTAGTAP